MNTSDAQVPFPICSRVRTVFEHSPVIQASLTLARSRGIGGRGNITCLLAIVSLLVTSGCAEKAPTSGGAFEPQSLETIKLPIAGKSFTLQLADDPKEREKGLMFVTSMPADRGMIFVFPSAEPRSFWMKNTPIDLDIIYLGADRKVVSIHTMKANTLEGTPSDGEAQFAIELNRDVARQLNLSAGQVVDVPANLVGKAQ